MSALDLTKVREGAFINAARTPLAGALVMALIAVPVSLGSFRNIEFAPTFVLAPVIAAALFILLVVGSAATAVGKHVDTCHMWDGTVVGCPVTY